MRDQLGDLQAPGSELGSWKGVVVTTSTLSRNLTGRSKVALSETMERTVSGGGCWSGQRIGRNKSLQGCHSFGGYQPHIICCGARCAFRTSSFPGSWWPSQQSGHPIDSSSRILAFRRLRSLVFSVVGRWILGVADGQMILETTS